MIVNFQTREVAQRIDYDAWGQITDLQNEDEFTNIGFAGGLYYAHTGLIRFGARDYDSQTGRWTAKDPIGFGGGTSNLYEYGLNDPVNNKDSSGLQAMADSTSTYDHLSNAFNGIGLGEGATSAAIEQYQTHLKGRYAQYYKSPLTRSLPSARNMISNMEYLKMGRNIGGFVGAACTAAGAITDFQNPNVSNARASYRAAVGTISTVAGYFHPLAGIAVQLTGTGLEDGYDLGVILLNEFSKGVTATNNAMRNGEWIPTY